LIYLCENVIKGLTKGLSKRSYKKDRQMFNEILRKGNNGISKSTVERIVQSNDNANAGDTLTFKPHSSGSDEK